MIPEALKNTLSGLWGAFKTTDIIIPKYSDPVLSFLKKHVPGNVLAYTPQHKALNNQSRRPARIRITPVYPDGVKDRDIYNLARCYTDKTLRELNALIPDFFRDAGTGVELEDIYRFYLQFWLAHTEIELYTHCFETTLKHSKNPVTILDGQMSSRLIRQLLNELKINVANDNLTSQSSLTEKGFTKAIENMQQFPHQAAFDAYELGGVLAIVDSPTYLHTLMPVLEALAQHHRITLLVNQSNTVVEETILQRLTVHATPRVMTLKNMALPSRLQQAVMFLKQRQQEISRIQDKEDRAFCLNQVRASFSLIRKHLSIEALVDAMAPQVVIGCLDMSLYAPMLNRLRQQYPFKLINVQHGTISSTYTLERLTYDAYLVWNNRTRQTVLKDGYTSPESIKIVGNPYWEALKIEVEKAEASAQYRNIKAWQGDSPLIGAYTQYIKGYSTPASKRGYLESLRNYLREKPNAKLLLKKHPLEDDTLCEEIFSGSDVSSRVQILGASQLSLAESLKAVDVVTSVFSATLVDALSLGKPVVAIDFENTLDRQNCSLRGAAIVVDDPKDVSPVLNNLLSPEDSPPHPLVQQNFEQLENIIPQFKATYTERIQQALADFTLAYSGSALGQ